jgi:hypothetical protein
MHTHSAARVTTKDRIACLHKEASNSIAESNHASSTHSLKTSRTIRLDSAAGEGQTRANNDFGQGHNAFVSGRSSKNGNWSAPMDAFILYQLNSNNQLLRLLDVELLMRENALMMPSIKK